MAVDKTDEVAAPANVSRPKPLRLAGCQPGSESLVFDRAVALERVEGDEELLRDVVGVFLECCGPMLDDVWQASAQGDLRAAERAAHTLKGSLANIAANEAWGSASELETLAREGRWGDVGAASKRLEQALGRLQPSLEAYLETATAA